MVDIQISILQLLVIAIIGWVIIDFFTIFTKNAMVSLYLNPKNTLDSGMVLLFYLAIFLSGVILSNNIQNQFNMNIGNVAIPESIIAPQNSQISNNVKNFNTYKGKKK